MDILCWHPTVRKETMPTLLELYEKLKPKLGEDEARALLESIESTVERRAATKEDLQRTEANLREDLQRTETSLREGYAPDGNDSPGRDAPDRNHLAGGYSRDPTSPGGKRPVGGYSQSEGKLDSVGLHLLGGHRRYPLGHPIYPISCLLGITLYHPT